VQAAMISEAGIRATEHLEMDATNQNNCILKMHKALLKQMTNSDVVPGELKASFQKIEGTADDVLNGEAILKRFKPFKGKMMNTIVPLLPINIHDIPSGKHLWEAFDRVCLAVCKKQQKASLTKRRRKEKVATPPANEDEAMKEIDELTTASVSDGWMCQKGHPGKPLLSVKLFHESKAFPRSSAEGAKPAHSGKEIRIKKTKQKLQDFADGRNDIHKEEAAKTEAFRGVLFDTSNHQEHLQLSIRQSPSLLHPHFFIVDIS
jgi:hypothetical protein